MHHPRQESQCRIDIENTRSGEHAMRVIRIRGNMQQTQVAQQLITQRVSPPASPPRPSLGGGEVWGLKSGSSCQESRKGYSTVNSGEGGRGWVQG